MKFNDLKTRLRRAGIRIVNNETNAWSVGFVNGAYEIRTGDFKDEEANYQALSHEVSHIIRGDLRKVREGINPKIMNIAADAHINNEVIVKALKKVNFNPIYYEGLREEVKALPEVIPSTTKLYDILMENNNNGSGGGDNNNDNDGDGVFDSLEKPETVITDEQQFETLCKIRKEGIDTGKDIFKIREQRFKPTPIPALDALIKKARGYGGTMQKSKTWARPNTRSKVLRGSMYIPRPKVAVILDTSGSMSAYIATICGALKALRETHDVYVIAHTVDVYYSGKLMPDLMSGGTAFVPAYKEAGKLSMDLIIHFTDGETSDFERARKEVRCPVIWSRPENNFNPEVK